MDHHKERQPPAEKLTGKPIPPNQGTLSSFLDLCRVSLGSLQGLWLHKHSISISQFLSSPRSWSPGIKADTSKEDCQLLQQESAHMASANSQHHRLLTHSTIVCKLQEETKSSFCHGPHNWIENAVLERFTWDSNCINISLFGGFSCFSGYKQLTLERRVIAGDNNKERKR